MKMFFKVNGSLFSLAAQGLRRSKGKALRVLAVLALSFGFALASLSLSASIQATNQEFAKNIYGEWYLGVLAGQERDGAWLSQQRWLIQLGTARPWGQVDTPTGPAALGTLDEGMCRVGRLRLSAGRWPQAEGELAAEAAVLAQLGLADPQPGQQLTLPVRLETESGPVTLYRTYTLCGVIQPYTDRWVLTKNATGQPTGQLLVSLAVADPEARSLQREAGAAEPVCQYFMTVHPGGRDQAVSQLNEYLGLEKAPSVNHQAYTASTPPSDPVLAGIMGLTALAAVLCIQVMQLPEQVRRFATLRSLGMTWGQGAALSLWEALLLAVPAVVLGLPLAGAVVWIALRAVVFAGPMPFTVVLPGRSMLATALMWLGLYAAARLSVVWAAWRTPLVGQFQLPSAARRRLCWARQGLIACLLLGFGVTVIHTEMQAVPHWERREAVRQQPHYDLSAQEGLLTDSQLAQLRQLPGMLESLPVSRSYVGLEYPGLAEHRARLVVLENAAPWADVLDFGPDAAAFDAGQQVLLCFPTRQVPDQMLSAYHTPEILLAPGEDLSNRDYPLPDAEVQLHFYSGQGEALACRAASVRVCRLGPEASQSRGLFLLDPYTVVCSRAFVERMLANLPAGTRWGEAYFPLPQEERGLGTYVAGQELGWQRVLLRAEPNVVGVDAVLQRFCSQQELRLLSMRQNLLAEEQLQTQLLAQGYILGACGGAMLLLLLTAALSVEAQARRPSWALLRVLGMSAAQQRIRLAGTALARCAVALAGGWLLEFGGGVTALILERAAGHPEAYEGYWISLPTAARILLRNWAGFGSLGQRAAVLSLLCVVLPGLACWAAQAALRKSEKT